MALLLLLSFSARAADVSPVFNQSLPALPDNQEVLMVTVEYAPGESSPPHRHNAHTYVYVLDGAIEMQVEGGELAHLEAGHTFYEYPHDVHVVSRNASTTASAKFLVFFIKTIGVPTTTMVTE